MNPIANKPTDQRVSNLQKLVQVKEIVDKHPGVRPDVKEAFNTFYASKTKLNITPASVTESLIPGASGLLNFATSPTSRKKPSSLKEGIFRAALKDNPVVRGLAGAAGATVLPFELLTNTAKNLTVYPYLDAASNPHLNYPQLVGKTLEGKRDFLDRATEDPVENAEYYFNKYIEAGLTPQQASDKIAKSIYTRGLAAAMGEGVLDFAIGGVFDKTIKGAKNLIANKAAAKNALSKDIEVANILPEGEMPTSAQIQSSIVNQKAFVPDEGVAPFIDDYKPKMPSAFKPKVADDFMSDDPARWLDEYSITKDPKIGIITEPSAPKPSSLEVGIGASGKKLLKDDYIKRNLLKETPNVTDDVVQETVEQGSSKAGKQPFTMPSKDALVKRISELESEISSGRVKAGTTAYRNVIDRIDALKDEVSKMSSGTSNSITKAAMRRRRNQSGQIQFGSGDDNPIDEWLKRNIPKIETLSKTSGKSVSEILQEHFKGTNILPEVNKRLVARLANIEKSSETYQALANEANRIQKESKKFDLSYIKNNPTDDLDIINKIAEGADTASLSRAQVALFNKIMDPLEDVVTNKTLSLTERADKLKAMADDVVKYSKVQSELGRAQGIFKYTDRLRSKVTEGTGQVPKDYANTFADQVRDMVDELRKKAKVATPEEAAKIESIISDTENIAAPLIPGGSAKIKRPGFVRAIEKTVDSLYTVYINLLLKKPSTQAVNSIGTGINGTVIPIVDKTLAVGFDKLLSMSTKKRDWSGKEVVGYIQGLFKGANVPDDVINRLADDFVSSSYMQPFGTGAKNNVVAHIQNLANAITTAPTQMMSTSDKFIKAVAAKAHFRSLLDAPPSYRNSISLIEDSVKFGNYVGYTEEVGRFGKILQYIKQEIPGGRWITPFTRITSNIIKQALNRTVVGGIYDVSQSAIGKTLTQRELALKLSRMTSGLFLTKIAYDLYKNGDLMGDLSKIEGRRNVQRDIEKRAPNSIVVGNAQMPLAMLGAPGDALGMMANSFDAYKESVDKGDKMLMSVVKGFLGGATAGTQRSTLYGIKTTLDNAHNLPEVVLKKLSDIGAVYMSAMQNEFVDVYQRGGDDYMDKIQAMNPFSSKDLPIKTNVAGEVKRRQNYSFFSEDGPVKSGNYLRLADMFHPGNVLRLTPLNPTDKEKKLIGTSVSQPNKFVGDYELSGKEYQELLNDKNRLFGMAIERFKKTKSATLDQAVINRISAEASKAAINRFRFKNRKGMPKTIFNTKTYADDPSSRVYK